MTAKFLAAALSLTATTALAQAQPSSSSPPPAPSGSVLPVSGVYGSAPEPYGNPGSWITSGDYPAEALQAQVEGTTGFRLIVGPNGIVANCEITKSAGSKILDDAACRLVTSRARFIPAGDSSGKPISGTYNSRVRWVYPVAGEIGARTQINAQPKPGVSVITFVIGTNGHAAQCEVLSGPIPTIALGFFMPCDMNAVYPVYADAQGQPVPRKVRMAIDVTVTDPTLPPVRKKRKR